jgi:hypothetical protein
VRLALVASLQYLPPRQRVVLILRGVLAWSAAEVAELLDISVAAVKSALQMARARSDDLAPVADQVGSGRPAWTSRHGLHARCVAVAPEVPVATWKVWLIVISGTGNLEIQPLAW